MEINKQEIRERLFMVWKDLSDIISESEELWYDESKFNAAENREFSHIVNACNHTKLAIDWIDGRFKGLNLNMFED